MGGGGALSAPFAELMSLKKRCAHSERMRTRGQNTLVITQEYNNM